MQFWFDEKTIRVEGTHEEWRGLVQRMVTEFNKYNSTDSVVHDLVKFLNETAAVNRRHTRRKRRPDLEWYDTHETGNRFKP
jgi:hypothetical protein